MNDRFRRGLEMLTHARDFAVAHPASFQAGKDGEELIAQLGGLVVDLQDRAQKQHANRTGRRNITATIGNMRDGLIDQLDLIALNGDALSVRDPGLAGKFRLPANLNDEVLMATARSFAKAVAPLKDRFLALQMTPTFIEDLEKAIEAFETLRSDRHKATDADAEATAEMEGFLPEGFGIVQLLNAIIHNNVPRDDALITAWSQASHVVRAPRPKKPQEAPGGPTPVTTGGTPTVGTPTVGTGANPGPDKPKA